MYGSTTTTTTTTTTSTSPPLTTAGRQSAGTLGTIDGNLPENEVA
jgi:hypothetical protein